MERAWQKQYGQPLESEAHTRTASDLQRHTSTVAHTAVLGWAVVGWAVVGWRVLVAGLRVAIWVVVAGEREDAATVVVTGEGVEG